MDDTANLSPPIPPEETVSPTVSIAVEELAELKNQAEEYKHKYLHALAEGENSRKRLQKERQEMIQHALQKMIVEFLNPIDQLENALKYAEEATPEIKNWAMGFKMISTQFKDVLSGHGVTSFASEGHPFDPHSHDAIEAITGTEHPPGTVIKEHIRGYKMGGRVIRPARVHVAKGEAPAMESTEEDLSEVCLECEELLDINKDQTNTQGGACHE